MKHKHADLIKQWADGAVIQHRLKLHDGWVDVTTPQWDSVVWEYRIKPEEKKPVVRWLWVTENRKVTDKMYTEDETRKIAQTQWTKLEWSRTEFES